MFRFFAVFLVLVVGTPARSIEGAPRRILILGASISWGCNSDCSDAQVEGGYVERLRLLLPDDEIRVAAWFGSGVADWDPQSVPIADQSLGFPVGVWEEGFGSKTNLWKLMAVPQLCSWTPDYVVVMAGLGDVLRLARAPSRTVTSLEDYADGVGRISQAILRSGAFPVLAVDAPFFSAFTLFDAVLEGYGQSIQRVCDESSIPCGPVLPSVIDRYADYVGTDGVHPNSLGHQAIAQAFADWFLTAPSPEAFAQAQAMAAQEAIGFDCPSTQSLSNRPGEQRSLNVR